MGWGEFLTFLLQMVILIFVCFVVIFVGTVMYSAISNKMKEK